MCFINARYYETYFASSVLCAKLVSATSSGGFLVSRRHLAMNIHRQFIIRNAPQTLAWLPPTVDCNSTELFIYSCVIAVVSCDASRCLSEATVAVILLSAVRRLPVYRPFS